MCAIGAFCNADAGAPPEGGAAAEIEETDHLSGRAPCFTGCAGSTMTEGMRRLALLVLALWFAASGLFVQVAHARAHSGQGAETHAHHDDHGHHHDLPGSETAPQGAEHPEELHLVGFFTPVADALSGPEAFAPAQADPFNGYREPGPSRDPDPERT